MSVQVKNEVIKIILEFFKSNNFIKKDDLDYLYIEIENSGNEIIALDFFRKKYPEQLTDILEACYENKFFSQEKYRELEKSLDDFLKVHHDKVEEIISQTEDNKINTDNSIEEESVEKEQTVEEFLNEREIKKDTEKKNKGEIIDFTEEYIKNLIIEGKNLYKTVPGNKVPKDDNQFYTEIQLKRFIDSGASDFIIETQKKGGKIYSMIKFKIAGEHEIQDITDPAYISDKTKYNLNPFFDTVRKYIGGSLGRMNADAKHIVQDSSFSLDYRGKSRDFRLSSLPTRCYGTPLPRYCIRLTSEGDNIDFFKIELLPFMKEYYLDIMNNKRPGMIAFTGPTGSGKTTTIYGVLNALDKNKLGIGAIEKPIESQLNGINQTEEDSTERQDKNERYTNKEFMKAVLRQALDVIFVGEMRDKEETQQGVKTGLVGNKLITTFHTNSAVDTILRLKEEGVTNNAIGNGVKDITAQRLVQKVCPHCSKKHPEMKKHIRKIKTLFKTSKIYCQDKLMELFESLKDNEINDLERMEIKMGKQLVFLSNKDVNLMVEMLEEKFDEYISIQDKKDKIEFLLELYKDFPNPELSKWIDEQIENAEIKVADEQGCDYEYEKDGNSFYCKGGYLTERIMIAEGLHIDKPIKRFIQDPDSKLNDLESFLIDKGFIDMKMYGYILAMQGITTLEKINEVIEE